MLGQIMSFYTITSYITHNGVPATGLSPTIRIWEIGPIHNTLIIGEPEGTGDPGTGVGTDGTMMEVFDKTVGIPGSGDLPIDGSRDGFYSFTFTDAMGYSASKSYVVRVDGGSSLPIYERYQTANIVSTSGIVDSILNEPVIDHTQIGSVGAILNQTHANTQQTVLNMVDVLDMIQLVLKYDTNRTKIDPANFTLTIYDNDCVTPLRTFKLLDSLGHPSVTDVCERSPQSTNTTDGLPTCT